ncbi:MAG: hypothetical protein GY754_28275 [bacterium]|nr:hypothetical protein [bacterium]
MKLMITFGMCLSIVFFAAISTRSLYALQVTPDVYPTASANQFTENAAREVMDGIVSKIKNVVGDSLNSQEGLAHGFGNSTAYASRAATLEGYQGYDSWAVMAGAMAGVQAPSFNLQELTGIGSTIAAEKDVYAGAGMGAAVNVGINAHFLSSIKKNWLKNLYFNLKFGYSSKLYNLSSSDTNLGFDSLLLAGFGVNYRLVRPGSSGGLFKWRGVSLGCGFLYTRNNLELRYRGLEAIEQIVPDSAGLVARLDPDILLSFDSTIFTVPFDISSSIRLLHVLNLSCGLGFDLNAGSTDIIIKNRNAVYITDSSGTQIGTPGEILISASTKAVPPSIVRGRVSVGLGINAGPVILINALCTYYLGSGASLGLSAGFSW